MMALMFLVRLFLLPFFSLASNLCYSQSFQSVPAPAPAHRASSINDCHRHTIFARLGRLFDNVSTGRAQARRVRAEL